MAEIFFDLSKTAGELKVFNAVNNGPTGESVRLSGNDSNFDSYKALKIPYARTHDASFSTAFGGEFSVDVHRIFRDFNADENDEASYIFEPTDRYLSNMVKAGTEPFYRLGASIEHNYKFGTYPPADFEKWARICEHIIMHYNEGWNNGYHMNIQYWEIWNEPDCMNADGSNPCWQGTEDEFVQFYVTASSYLKKKFPNLQIGGPAFCTLSSENFVRKFLSEVKSKNAPLDFFSYHCYSRTTESFAKDIRKGRELLDEYGFSDTKTILNEWNYVKGWSGELWDYSIRAERGVKGASFVAAIASLAQKLSLDMLMYYDARPCRMNGLFDQVTLQPLKSYYIFEILRDIAEEKTALSFEVTGSENIYALGAKKDGHSELMITHYNDCDETVPEEVSIRVKNPDGKVKVEYYLTDEENNNKHIRDEIFTAEEFSIYLTMELFTTYNIKITKI